MEASPRAFGHPLILRSAASVASANCTYRICVNRGRFRCSRCKAWYCSPMCQYDDWQDHRFDCHEPPPLEHPDGTLVRPPRALRRPDRAALDEPTSATGTVALATPTTVTANDPNRREEARRHLQQVANGEARLGESCHGAHGDARTPTPAKDDHKTSKPAEEKLTRVKTELDPAAVRKENAAKAPEVKAVPDVQPTKTSEPVFSKKPASQMPPTKAEERTPSKKQETTPKKVEIPATPAKLESTQLVREVPSRSSPSPAKVESKRDESVVANGIKEEPAAANGTLAEEDELVASCVLDAVEGAGCDVTVMVETSDPDAGFSPADVPCLVSFEELGVGYVLEEMQEAWKERVKTEKPLTSVKAGEFVVFSKHVPEEGLTFVRAIVLAVNPKGDRVNALDIDSGYAKKIDLTSVYRMRPEDKEQPGLGARLKAVSPLNSTQENAIKDLFHVSMQSMKVDKLDSGVVKGFLRTEEGKRICEYKLVPWYEVDSRIAQLMGYEVDGASQEIVKAKETAKADSAPLKEESKMSDEAALKAKMKEEIESKRREMEALMAQLNGISK